MRKYSWIVMTLCMIMAFSMTAFASDLTVGYKSSEGQMNLTIGGSIDVGGRSSLKGSYTILRGSGFDIAAQYKMALLRGALNIGPMVEGSYTKQNDLKSLEYGAGVFVEKPVTDSGLGLSARATYRINKDAGTAGVVIGAEAKFPLTKNIFLGADMDMGITGSVAGTDISFKVGYQF